MYATLQQIGTCSVNIVTIHIGTKLQSILIMSLSVMRAHVILCIF